MGNYQWRTFITKKCLGQFSRPTLEIGMLWITYKSLDSFKLKKMVKVALIILGFALTTSFSFDSGSQFSFKKMMVEYAENPIHIDEPHPRLSWIISSTGRNQTQKAYRIIVASSIKFLSLNRGV